MEVASGKVLDYAVSCFSLQRKMGTSGMWSLLQKAGVWLAWHLSRASGSTSTRTTSRSLWLVAGMSRNNSRTPNQVIASHPRRRWKHSACCCLMRLLECRQSLEVVKSCWWTLGWRACTHLPIFLYVALPPGVCVCVFARNVCTTEAKCLRHPRRTREMGIFSLETSGELSAQQQRSELRGPWRRLRICWR